MGGKNLPRAGIRPPLDAAYREVYTDEFRQALLYRCSKSDINRLLVFLNKWLSRLPYAKIDAVLQESVPEAIAELRVWPPHRRPQRAWTTGILRLVSAGGRPLDR